jgi:hypothetical protein
MKLKTENKQNQEIFLKKINKIGKTLLKQRKKWEKTQIINLLDITTDLMSIKGSYKQIYAYKFGILDTNDPILWKTQCTKIHTRKNRNSE